MLWNHNFKHKLENGGDCINDSQVDNNEIVEDSQQQPKKIWTLVRTSSNKRKEIDSEQQELISQALTNYLWVL